jgi:hypothetical protein
MICCVCLFVCLFVRDTRRPVVKFHSGVEKIIGTESFSLTLGHTVCAQRTQLPLDLAWSLSVHKAQGMVCVCVCVCVLRMFTPFHVCVCVCVLRMFTPFHVCVCVCCECLPHFMCVCMCVFVQTVDSAIVNLKKTFECGQAYGT